MNLLCNWRVISFVFVSKNFAVLFADDKCVLLIFSILFLVIVVMNFVIRYRHGKQ
jgi:hypothetical protein